jgi:5'-nucleotidase
MIQLQAAGLTYSFDPARPEGQRLVDLEVGGEPLDDRREYTVVSNSYLVDYSPDRPDFSGGRDLRLFEQMDRDAVRDYLGRHRPYVPAPAPSVVNLANRVE